MSRLKNIHGIGPALSGALEGIGVTSLETLAKADPASLSQLRGVTPKRAQAFIDAARALGTVIPAKDAVQTRAEVAVDDPATTVEKTKKKAKKADKKEAKSAKKNAAKKKSDKKKASDKTASKAKANVKKAKKKSKGKDKKAAA